MHEPLIDLHLTRYSISSIVSGMATTMTLTRPIEAISIAEDGAALGGMVDFSAGETIEVEQQAPAGETGVFGWEGHTIAYYRSRGWRADTETVFRQKDHRYATLNPLREDS